MSRNLKLTAGILDYVLLRDVQESLLKFGGFALSLQLFQIVGQWADDKLSHYLHQQQVQIL